MSGSTDIRRLGRLLSNRDYAIFMAGNGLSLIGTWAQRLAAGWLIWELTGSAFLLGVLVFADLVPTILFAPLGGALADRMDRIRLLRACQAVGAALALALAVLVFAGLLSPWLLIGLTVVQGINEAVAQPARLSMVHDLVPREDVGAAIAFSAVIFNVARFIGPAMAGALITFAGAGFSFLVNVVSFLIFFFALGLVTVTGPKAPHKGGTVGSEIAEGIRYTLRDPGLARLIGMMLCVGLLVRPIIELLPGLSGEYYGASAAGLAGLTSSVALGALVGGVWLGSLAETAPRVHIVGASALGFALGALALTVMPQLWMAAVVLVFVGLANVGTFIVAQTLLQLRAPPEMRGRVLSVYGMVFRGAPALGALVIGALADSFGFGLPIAAAAALAALLSVPIWLGLARQAKSDSAEHAEERPDND